MILNTSFGFMLTKAAQRLASICEAELLSLRLTTRQAGLLMVVKGNGPASQKTIGELLRIDRTTMVALVDDLEAKTYLKRVEDPEDRRAYRIMLSEKGKTVLGNAWRIIQSAESKGLEDLSIEERQLLAQLLLKSVK